MLWKKFGTTLDKQVLKKSKQTRGAGGFVAIVKVSGAGKKKPIFFEFGATRNTHVFIVFVNVFISKYEWCLIHRQRSK